MVGDLILFMKRWIHQNLFCIHNYEEKHYSVASWSTCTKCGRIRKNYNNSNILKSLPK